MKNLDVLKSLASTKYGDFKGVISIDQQGQSDIWELCEKNGIDTEQYFIVGFGMSPTQENRGTGFSDKVVCSVLLLDSKKYGSSAQAIIDNTCGVKSIKAIQKSFNTTYREVEKHIKRFGFMSLLKFSEEATMPLIEVQEG